jgi:triphosphatase
LASATRTGAEIELSLDLGALKHGEQREAISEVELELKAGATQAPFDLALQLQEQVPLRVGNRSKAARGYALQAPVTAAAAAMKARPIALRAEISVEAGFQAIFSNCIAQMQDNEFGVVQGADPESIHQMRVGMRRLRSALRLFARWIPFPPTLQQELGWLAGELGSARDADVLANGTLPKVVAICPQEADLLPLREVVSTFACEKRQQAAAAVASVRHSRLMLRLIGWLHTSHWRESLSESARGRLAEPLEMRATRILVRRHEKLIELGRRLPQSTPEVRHEVRIAAKRARYATEFFQSLYPARRVNRYVSGLAALQDRLGWLNDAAVADPLLREIGTHRSELARGASFARGWLCATIKQDLPGLDKSWKKFTSTKPPWAHRK